MEEQPDRSSGSPLYNPPVQVLINFAEYADRVTIHCLAADARTLVAPFKRVSSLETLYRLIEYIGVDPKQCREEMNKWGHGSVWAEVEPEHFKLLGIELERSSTEDSY